MRMTRVIGLALLAPLLLTACFLLPGTFSSSLDLRRDGGFDFAYKGQIVLLSPYGAGARGLGGEAAFKDDPSRPCYGPINGNLHGSMQPGRVFSPPPAPSGKPDITVPQPPPQQSPPPPIVFAPAPPAPRPCTAAERSERSANFALMNAEAATRRKADGEKLAAIIGMNPNDDASMRAYAAQVAKQAGWRSAVYRGNGVFDVDFQLSGRLDRDFVFPLPPRAAVIMPFVIIRKRADGAVLISAPGYRANPARAMMEGAGSAMAGMAGKTPMQNGPQGSFIITTDAAPLTNNTDEGPTTEAGRSVLRWTVAPDSDKIPEALIPTGR